MTPLQPYAERHKDLQGPGDARPTAEQIIHDQRLAGALPGHVILITGCTSGIGIETARALNLTGAKIYITARNLVKGKQVATELSTDPSRPVQVLEMSLDSFTSIRAAAAEFLQKEKRLNILINNAGIMACPQGVTKDGFELQFGTNHLGHFLLFHLLKPALLAAATPTSPSRIITVSSSAHRNCSALPFDDVDFSKSPYNPWIAYARSKLANIYFSNELSRRYAAQNVLSLSLHPGSISTSLQQHVEGSEIFESAKQNPEYARQEKSLRQGAATTVWAAVGKEWVGSRGGVYLEDVGEAEAASKEGPAWRVGFGSAAFKPADERRLWEVSCWLCGLKEDAPDSIAFSAGK